MKSESIKIYTRRIASANKSELIVIIYDIIVENLSLAEEAMKSSKKEEAYGFLKETIPFLKELLSSLAMQYEISQHLASLYLYVMRCLNFASVNGNIEEIKTAKRMMQTLRLSFVEVAKQDTSSPMMEDTEQLFAGFTYGKHLDLNETMFDEKASNRGYRV